MPIEGVAEFTAAFEREVGESLPREVRAQQIKLARNIARGIVRRTKVKSGRARGNWQVTTGSPAEGEVAPDKSIGSVMSKVYTALNGLKNYDVAYITNNVPYIQTLENRRGMVARTLREQNESEG